MIRIIREDRSEASHALQICLIEQLGQGEHVLWLVPGGSNIPIAASIMTDIPTELTSQLTIMLTDERYGKVDHEDSNALQLHQAGFDAKHATFLPVLTGDPLEDTVRSFSEVARVQFATHRTIIGQFGIGADGHIAGILPKSSAASEQKALAVGYFTANFTRVTLTFPALRQINIAHAFVYGTSKRETLMRLQQEHVPLEIQPAQILKAIPQAYVYNDQIG